MGGGELRISRLFLPGSITIPLALVILIYDYKKDVYVHIHTHIYIYIYIYIYHTHTYIYIHMYMYICGLTGFTGFGVWAVLQPSCKDGQSRHPPKGLQLPAP